MNSPRETITQLSLQMRKAVRAVTRRHEKKHLLFVATFCTELLETKNLPGVHSVELNPLFPKRIEDALNQAVTDTLTAYGLSIGTKKPLLVHELKVI